MLTSSTRARGTVPPAEDCVLSAMLDKRAAETPDKECIVFEDGPTWTYARTRDEGRRFAAALTELGVKKADLVLVWLPNGPQIFALALGLSYVGAVFVPVNIALKGKTLEHIVTNSGARLMFANAALLPNLEAVHTGCVETIVVLGGSARSRLRLRMLDERALALDRPSSHAAPQQIEPWDTNAIFYTSGTTGPAKGVICPHLHTHAMAIGDFHFVTRDDRFLINLPFFHIAGAVVPYIVLDRGASMAMLKDFDGRNFWTQARKTRSTTCMFLGTMAEFLMKQPPTEDDTAHSLRTALLQPVVRDAPAFCRRFGVTIYTSFDMTESGPAIVSDALPADKPVAKGYCGRLRVQGPRFEARLVDEHDCEVPIGEAGELVLRSDLPWVITPGYYGMPEATANAWRNGWFHTGDALRKDADGNYYFVDRQKDCIRRRGENISSTDVEAELLAYGAIEMAAAIGVSSAEGEEEILVVLQPKQGHCLDLPDLVDFLSRRVAHFMVPRFFRVMQQLPTTPTGKVQKGTLRAQGLASDAWDREKAGIIIKRARLQ